MSNKEAIGLTVCQSSKHKYRIGFEIGSGSCATVHELDAVLSESSPSKNNLEKRTIATQFVIKLAPTGKSKTSTQTGKPKRKKKTTAERKADLLYYEYGLYRNTFGLVLGSLMPNLPDTLDKSQPPDYGEVEGELPV